MSDRTRITTIVMCAVIAVAAFFGGAAYWLLTANGFSTRTTPTAVERIIMRGLHRWSVPSNARTAANPVPFTPEVWAESRAHFADHCASCHGNDGRGDTELGRSLFPKAPDMHRPATQMKSDGELYWIIENGIRLTGMPGWGTGGPDDADSWKLVHFIRHLEELSPDQLKAMAAANPKSPSELEEEKADERFLAGEDEVPPAVPPHHH
jgi:mono/diheme cytochrome c family protein